MSVHVEIIVFGVLKLIYKTLIAGIDDFLETEWRSACTFSEVEALHFCDSDIGLRSCPIEEANQSLFQP